MNERSQAQPGHDNPWTCVQCGEEVDAEFDVCWNCGTAADGRPDESFEAVPASAEEALPPRAPRLPMTTTPGFEGRLTVKYRGIVFGEAILGTNVFSDTAAGMRDVVGGRSSSYERKLARAREAAMSELNDAAAAAGANGVIGVSFQYETVRAGMLMVVATGTAVDLEVRPPDDAVAGV